MKVNNASLITNILKIFTIYNVIQRAECIFFCILMVERICVYITFASCSDVIIFDIMSICNLI